MIIRPLTLDYTRDQYDDLARDGASAAETELTVRSGRGGLPRYRTGQVHASAAPASPGGPALELGAAFAATPYLLDDF